MKKYIYAVYDGEEQEGVCVVATSEEQAKEIVKESGALDIYGVVANRVCEAEDGMEIGQIIYDWKYCLKIGAFNCAIEDCPRCGAKNVAVFYDKRYGFYCTNCEDTLGVIEE